MGLLIEGKWVNQWYNTASTGSKFERKVSHSFETGLQRTVPLVEQARLALKRRLDATIFMQAMLAYGVHRVLIYRKLKGLENAIDVSFVHWYMGEQGWTFNKDEERIVGDHLFDLEFTHQLYTMADKNYTGRVTVPILWDKDQNTIVSNESSEIIRMLNSTFDDIGANDGDYYPTHLHDEIDKINHRIYHTINNGVYKSGFFYHSGKHMRKQFILLFETLNWLEAV